MRTPLSIRTRVTLAATAAVLLVSVVAGVLTVTTFAQRERSSLDDELRGRAEGPLRRIGEGPFGRFGPPGRLGERPPRGFGGPGEGAPGPGPGGPPTLFAGSGSFVRVLEGDRVVVANGDVPSGDFPVPDGLGFATVDAAGRKWRTLTTGFGGRPDVRIQLAADLSRQEERIDEMTTRVVVISALAIALAALLAWLFADLALRPLAGLRERVAGVSTTRDLSRRLPARGSPEEVRGLAESVNAMLTRLERSAGETERALEATRRFAADVGHELRTPLTSIRANFDALRRNPSLAPEERRAILDELAAEQREVAALLEALQALARGEAGAALPRERLDFGEIVDSAVESAGRRHPETKITLVANGDRQPLTGWPDGLRLLVDNLIENAARHGGSDVRVQLARNGDGHIVFAVDDDGPGVAPAERDRIFERFARGSTRAPGSGLGLALVAQQVELHEGTIVVSDSALGGARFEVRLPLNDASA